jgi:Family of unknown function (DUF6690)
MGRVLFPVLFLAGAAGLPYLSSEWSKPASSAVETANDIQQAQQVSATSPTSATPALVTPQPVAPPKPQLGEPPVVGITESIRFDVTTAWIINRWPRVTAGLPEGELQGYRVPLVSGTRHDEIAGSLTYYFNAQQMCQKITFHGVTGDPHKITSHVVNQFGLSRQINSDPGLHLYQTRWNGKPVSELKIKAMPVVKADAAHARYDVELTLNNWSRSPLLSLFNR